MGDEKQSYQPPAGYESWTADRKAEWLWTDLIVPEQYDDISLPPYTQDMLAILGTVIRPSVLGRSFIARADVMPEGRPKIIHTRGSVAMVELVTRDDSPFTGLLAPKAGGGGAIGLIRLSTAAPYDQKTPFFIPGFGLKLLIDGRPSADTLAMNHTNGQGRDIDMFSNPCTHDLRNAHRHLRDTGRKMDFFFRFVTSQPRHLLIDHFAEQRRDGTEVADPVVPDRLVFEPSPEVHRFFRGHEGEDYRRTLWALESGTTLYDLASVSDDDGPSVPIGSLRTTTEFVSSPGGDRIWFHHEHDPANLKIDASQLRS